MARNIETIKRKKKVYGIYVTIAILKTSVQNDSLQLRFVLPDFGLILHTVRTAALNIL